MAEFIFKITHECFKNDRMSTILTQIDNPTKSTIDLN